MMGRLSFRFSRTFSAWEVGGVVDTIKVILSVFFFLELTLLDHLITTERERT